MDAFDWPFNIVSFKHTVDHVILYFNIIAFVQFSIPSRFHPLKTYNFNNLYEYVSSRLMLAFSQCKRTTCILFNLFCVYPLNLACIHLPPTIILPSEANPNKLKIGKISLSSCISPTFSANNLTQPARQCIEACCTSLSIVTQDTTSSPSMVLCIGHRVIS